MSDTNQDNKTKPDEKLQNHVKEEKAKRYPGKPLQVVAVEDTGEDKKGRKVVVVEENLEQIVKNVEATGVQKLYIVSLVGAMRTGKSFMLDLFLRYLTEPQENIEKEGPHCIFKGTKLEEEKESQFYWRASYQRTTTGIWFYSTPFVRKIKGQDVCVLLMDTQGLFDPMSPPEINKAIFGLSVLLSSYQILNVQNRIQEDTLQQLDYFTQFAHSAITLLKDTHKPEQGEEDDKEMDADDLGIHKFQRLQFLVRDWINYEDPENVEENLKVTKSVLADTFKQTFNDSGQRDRITNSFDKVDALFLPHIGLKACRPNWKGDLNEVDPGFVKMCGYFLKQVFDETVVIKRDIVQGTEMEPKTLGYAVKSFAEVFKDGKLPKAISLVEAMTKATTLDAKDKALLKYRSMMDTKAGPNSTYIPQKELEAVSVNALEQARLTFKKIAAFGEEKQRREALDAVFKSIGEEFERYKEANKNRVDKILAGYATLCVIALFAFLVDMLSDYTCDWWSETCRTGSTLLKYLYTLMAMVVGGQVFLLYQGEGQFVVIKALSGLFAETSTQALNYYDKLREKAKDVGVEGLPDLKERRGGESKEKSMSASMAHLLSKD
uniref:GB1/RHD3-type G domain-containing protein n=1 Tax=Amorphochlora amoebiformis TaxID=1561963 RepID=A0A7S0CZW9_9EUKA